MLIATFTTFSTYSQTEVYAPGQSEYAGSQWHDQHVAQGFVWLPGSVGFGLLHDLGDHFVEVHLDEQVRLQSATVRAIVVPFTVPPDGKIEMTNCVNLYPVTLPIGDYALLFEAGYVGDRAPEDLDEASFWVRFTFVAQRDAQPAILIADDELSPAYPLLMGIHPPS